MMMMMMMQVRRQLGLAPESTARLGFPRVCHRRRGLCVCMRFVCVRCACLCVCVVGHFVTLDLYGSSKDRRRCISWLAGTLSVRPCVRSQRLFSRRVMLVSRLPFLPCNKQQVVVPADIPAGDYVVGWRWDCEMTSQVWSNCADITVV